MQIDATTQSRIVDISDTELLTSMSRNALGTGDEGLAVGRCITLA